MSISASPLPPTYVEGWSNPVTSSKIPYTKLGQTDMAVSLLTLGAAHVASRATDVKVQSDGTVTGVDDAVKAIREAIRLGINLIDTSPYYGGGLSELVVGQALKAIPRQAYYIATKAGRRSDCTFDFSAGAIRRSVEQSLTKLGVERIDLLQIHDVEFGDIDTILTEALPTLKVLRDQNRIGAIGITGYSLKVLKEIIERTKVKLDTVLSYCRHTLFDDELSHYLPFFESKGLGVISASPFGMGLYSLANPIPYWHPAPDEVKHACQQAAKLARSLGANINRLALQHSLGESRIHTHLIGMETLQMARLNVATITEPFNDNDRQMLDRIRNECFSNLTVHNWEGVEVERYRRDPQEFARFLKSGGK